MNPVLAGNAAPFARPIRRITAVAGVFLAVGIAGLISSTDDAGAGQAAAETAAVVQRAQQNPAGPQQILGRTEAERAAILFSALEATEQFAVTPGTEQVWVDTARAACDALPTWEALHNVTAQQLAGLTGSERTPAETDAFAAAAAAAYCPAQAAVLR